MIITSKENIFLSACGKAVSSDIDTKTTESFLSKYGDTQDVIRKKWVIIL